MERENPRQHDDNLACSNSASGKFDSTHRRKFIQTASSIAAFSSLLLGTTTRGSAQHGTGTPIGETTFLEVKLDHEGAPPWPRNNYDPLSPPAVDSEGNELQIVDLPSENVAMEVKNNKTLVHARKLRASPRSVYGRTTRSAQLGMLSALALKSPYSEPVVRFETPMKDAIDVSVNNNVTTITPGEEQVIELSERKVETSEPGDHSTTRTVTLRPRVTIRNFGNVNVRMREMEVFRR